MTVATPTRFGAFPGVPTGGIGVREEAMPGEPTRVHRQRNLARNLAVSAVFLVFQASGATVAIPGDALVSNLGSSTRTWDTLNREPVATKFSIGESDVLVTGIKIRMLSQSQGLGLTVRIASNVMDPFYLFERPAATMGTFATTPLEVFTTSDFFFASSIPFLLSGEAFYWVEVDGSDTSFSTVASWHGGSTGLTNSGIAGESFYSRIRGAYTDTYNIAPTGSFMAFELVGSVVPEAKSTLLIMISMVVISWRRTRRWRLPILDES